jgi:hypothetical protein
VLVAAWKERAEAGIGFHALSILEQPAKKSFADIEVSNRTPMQSFAPLFVPMPKKPRMIESWSDSIKPLKRARH